MLGTFDYKNIFLWAIIFFANSFSAQTNTNVRFTVQNPFYDRCFIENKGQYQLIAKNIISATQNQDMSVYFEPNGFLINIVQSEPEKENEFSKNETEREKNLKPEVKFQINFLNSSANTNVLLQEPTLSTVGFVNPLSKLNTINNIRSYNKLTYANLYPGINCQFTFDKYKCGIKYTYTVAPGADASQIKLNYPDAQIYTDKNGNLHIQKDGAEITDAAPMAFCDGKNIKANYKITGNSVSIELADYDSSKELIIDPFVINPAFTVQNKAFDVSRDNAGNIYVFGGQSPWKLKKFDNLGNLLWTFNTTYASWYGDLAVDNAGNSYITEGCCGGGIMKIANNNTVVWNNNYGTQEFWCLAFNCAQSILYLGQGYASAPFIAQSISTINLASGVVGGAVNIAASEPRALGWGPTGNMYVVTASGNLVIGVTPALATMFSLSSGHLYAYNGPTYANGSNPTSGQNGVAAGVNFFCTTDGATLYKRNLATGALLATVIIPGGAVEGNSGLLIDACGFIYVGSSSAILKYDSNLNLISSTVTTGAVYCLYPAVAGGEVLGCGNTFLGSYALSYNLVPCGGVCGALPVTFKNFNCESSGRSNKLFWETAEEKNISSFVIERSGDAENFYAIATVNSKNTSAQYEFYDSAPESNVINYYRVAAVEKSKHRITTEVCFANKTDELAISNIIPNPVTQHFSFNINSKNKTVVDVTIYTFFGEKVKTYSQNIESGTTRIELATDDLSAGVYIMELSSEQNEIIFKQKLVKVN